MLIGVSVFLMSAGKNGDDKVSDVVVPEPDAEIFFEERATVVIDTLNKAVVKTEIDWSKNIVINLAVPFVVQAPLGDWHDPRQQDGCEEAAVLMAMAWVKGEAVKPAAAEQTIIAMAEWQIERYGQAVDTSAQDTADRLLRQYYNHQTVRVENLTESRQIIAALVDGQIVLLPTNGQKLSNPYYKQPGPLTHMLVVKGYDPIKDEFITNDPGTKKGADYRYRVGVVMAAAADYATGNHEKQDANVKSMIVVGK